VQFDPELYPWFSVAAIAWGVLDCFFGYKVFKITLALVGCGSSAARDLGPSLQVVGESAGLRLEDPVATSSPWFDGERVTLVGARGETLGILVQHRDIAPTSLSIAGTEVRGYAVDAFRVRRPSTSMYGGSRGAGTYVDGLTPAAQPASAHAARARRARRNASAALAAVAHRQSGRTRCCHGEPVHEAPGPVAAEVTGATAADRSLRACGSRRAAAH